MTLDESGNDILITFDAPRDSDHLGGLAIDENGAYRTDFQKASDSDHFGSVGYAVTENGSIVDLSVQFLSTLQTRHPARFAHHLHHSFTNLTQGRLCTRIGARLGYSGLVIGQ